MVKLSSRVTEPVVALDSCDSERRAEQRTLVQSVAQGHLGQLHLGPRVVQDLPAPLERAEEALLLQPGFGTHIEPRAQSTSQTLELTHSKLDSISITLLSREIENMLLFHYNTFMRYSVTNVQISHRRNHIWQKLC